MKRLSKNQWIAVASGLCIVAFFLYGQAIVSLFTTPSSSTASVNTSSGVVVTDTTVGTGAEAKAGDTVTVDYVGTLTDGKVFDSSIDRHEPFTFVLGAGQVIRGWDEGVVGMKVGGDRKLTISPDYAYGTQAVGPIPANSTLVFTVHLLNVSSGAPQAQ